MTLQLTHFINGKRTAASERTQPVFEPATGEERGQVSLASVSEVEQAIAVAKAAQPDWAKTTPLNRARVLFKYKALVEAHADELAELITREHGKVFEDAKGELTRGLEVVEFACGIP
ncbi:MAG: aldehyde dehydrogenase family protein, partial [Pseudomonas sp.]|nr:aldehyde dehydrogenase family protein [Pseudomonas sp.]MBQ0776070.1 aldehyde dehydrogenase family protein [Pseudomonas sp.]